MRKYFARFSHPFIECIGKRYMSVSVFVPLPVAMHKAFKSDFRIIFFPPFIAINHSWTWIWLFCRAFGKVLFVCGLSWVLFLLNISFVFVCVYVMFYINKKHFFSSRHSPNSSILNGIYTFLCEVTKRISKLLNASCEYDFN